MVQKSEPERQLLLGRKEPEPGSRQPAPSALPMPDSLVFRPYPREENYNSQKTVRGGAVECSMMGVVV